MAKAQCQKDLKYGAKLNGHLPCATNEGYPFFSKKKDLITRLQAVSEAQDSFTCTHEYFWKESPAKYIWMNMMRDPVAQLESAYYYETDQHAYGVANAKYTVEQRQQDGCGCAFLEFNECIRKNAVNPKCQKYLQFYPQSKHFCDEDENHTVDTAFANMKERFVVVGLNEHYAETVKVLERTVPRIFKGAYAMYKEHDRNGKRSNRGAQYNPLTKTSMNGAVSSDVRHLLTNLSPENRREAELYQRVVRLFWRKYVALVPEDEDNT
jgi:hypothetical protein